MSELYKFFPFLFEGGGIFSEMFNSTFIFFALFFQVFWICYCLMAKNYPYAGLPSKNGPIAKMHFFAFFVLLVLLACAFAEQIFSY